MEEPNVSWSEASRAICAHCGTTRESIGFQWWVLDTHIYCREACHDAAWLKSQAEHIHRCLQTLAMVQELGPFRGSRPNWERAKGSLLAEIRALASKLEDMQPIGPEGPPSE